MKAPNRFGALRVLLLLSCCLTSLIAHGQPEEMWNRLHPTFPTTISGMEVDALGNLLVGRGSFGPQIAVVGMDGELQGPYTIGDGWGGTFVVLAFADRNAIVMASRTVNGVARHAFMSFEIDRVATFWPYVQSDVTLSRVFRPLASGYRARGVATTLSGGQDTAWHAFEYRWGDSEGDERPQIPFPDRIGRYVFVKRPFVEDPLSPGGSGSLIFSTYDNPVPYPHPVWMLTQSDYTPAWIQTDSFPGSSIYVTPNYDDQGNQYWLWRDEVGDWEWLQKYDRDGQPQWRVPLPRNFFAHHMLPGKNGKLPIFMRRGTLEVGCAYVDVETGIYQFFPLPEPGGNAPNLEISAVERDPFGSFVVVVNRFYRDAQGNPFGARLALSKISPDWELAWFRGGEDFYPGFRPYAMRFYQSAYLYVSSEPAQRIVKFRIRAAFVEGDASGDGCIDDKDLAMTLEAFGTTDPGADFNADGIVDDRDLERVLRNFGLGCVE